MKKLLFLLIAGFFCTTAFAQAGKMGKSVEQQIKKLTAALNEAGHPLQGTQKSDLTTSFTNTMQKMKEARSLGTSDRSAIDQVKRASEAEVKGILSPEQFVTFQNMRSNARGDGKAPRAGGQGTLGSKTDNADKKDEIPGWDEKPDKADRRTDVEETSRELSDAEVEAMEERKRKAQERREKMEQERAAKTEKAEKNEMKEEKKEMKDKMQQAKSNDKEWAKENKQSSKRNAKQKSIAAVESVTNALSAANMPLSSTQLKQVKTTMMQEQKKMSKLIEDNGEGSANYLKGAKKIRKSSIKKMKSFLSKEQFKFLKKAQF